MTAVIMAGGRGTRVASVNSDIPKPLLPIAGKPVLARQIECLARQSITDVIMVIGHLGSQIANYFGDGHGWGVDIDYFEEEVPLGTAGALYYLRDKLQDDFLLINGDLIFDVDLSRMMRFHRQKGALATLLVHPNDHPYDSGIVEHDREGRVTGWLTKEEERTWYRNCVNAGIHILSPELLRRIGQPGKLDLDRELLRPLIPEGRVYAYRSPEYVKDMGTPDRIKSVERDLQSGLIGKKNLRNKQSAVFLDRDGTINRYVGFLRNIDDFELLDGVAAAIRRLNHAGYLVIVVTNQPVIARGEITWDELYEIHCKMETLLGEGGAYVDDIFICPHHPDRGFPGERPEYKIACGCRKPNPGLLLQAAEKYNIDLTTSWMIGDSDTDVEAGLAAGCRSIKLGGALTLQSAVGSILSDGFE